MQRQAMAVASRATRTTATTPPPSELQIPKRWKDGETIPERTKVWAEPSKPSKAGTERRVPVVYYLSRNGQLEQPHFMEVPLSSPEGLFLSDVINRLNLLRGKGMAAMYSWSSKRSYKNGFVWHDLAENDFIYPSHGNEYVLKGSELLESPTPSSSSTARPLESVSFRSPKPINTPKSIDESDFPVIARRRNQSWSSIDLHEYKVYKAESNGESTPTAAADASTQTDDKRRRRRHVKERESEIRELRGDDGADQGQSQNPGRNQTTELSRDEISPPPSDSSPETLETLMKADGRLIIGGLNHGGKEADGGSDRAAGNLQGGKIRASSVLMQLISCGSLSFKDCGATYIKDQGLSLIGHSKTRLRRGAGDNNGSSGAGSGKRAGASGKIPNLAGLSLEDKEYFSGSLIETKKKDEVVVPVLKRSSSYNADRISPNANNRKGVE
ncbi:protein SOSEKI 5 isoform X1 [Syzygium oleosum]|uniref:protein SOSEKI 5 isoform X1 n=2 Tax=Syzygium oleosum TaxID=219896 RepID=UPI0024B9DF88|nr:protein SOSEKI 5 isoform X1 [Syzygium oleosum]